MDDRGSPCESGRAVPTELVERSDELGEESGTGREDERPGAPSTESDCNAGELRAGARSTPDDLRGNVGSGGARPLLDRLKLGRGFGSGIDSLSLSSLPDQPSS
jgi:hypothetical protein